MSDLPRKNWSKSNVRNGSIRRETMAKRKIYSAEQIITKLYEAEVLLGQGWSIKEARRALEISK